MSVSANSQTIPTNTMNISKNKFCLFFTLELEDDLQSANEARKIAR